MSLDDWLLALHLLSAFALVGAITLFSIVMLLYGRAETAGQLAALGPVLRLGNIAVAGGSLATFVFGVWLAISHDAIRLWDLWVILAVVGWVVATGVGSRAGKLAGDAFERIEEAAASGSADEEMLRGLRDPAIARFHWLATFVTLLILVDMIWKPGA